MGKKASEAQLSSVFFKKKYSRLNCLLLRKLAKNSTKKSDVQLNGQQLKSSLLIFLQV